MRPLGKKAVTAKMIMLPPSALLCHTDLSHLQSWWHLTSCPVRGRKFRGRTIWRADWFMSFFLNTQTLGSLTPRWQDLRKQMPELFLLPQVPAYTSLMSVLWQWNPTFWISTNFPQHTSVLQFTELGFALISPAGKYIYVLTSPFPQWGCYLGAP